MNIVDQLLKADVKKAEEFNEGVFQSKRLAKILGVDEPVPVKIKELPTRRLNDFVAYQTKSNGSTDYSKTYDTNLMACVEGCVEPNLMSRELQEHFGCKSAKELAEKIFRGEATDIAAAIAELSGINDDTAEEEVKN